MSNEHVTDEQRRNVNSSAAETDACDAGAVSTSEDSQQKLEDTCEQLLKQLKEARRDVGRPEDLRVNYQNSADRGFQL